MLVHPQRWVVAMKVKLCWLVCRKNGDIDSIWTTERAADVVCARLNDARVVDAWTVQQWRMNYRSPDA